MNIVLLTLAISTITTTITYGSIFRPLRYFDKTGLTHCPYCLSHWISALAALTVTNNLIDFIITTFALTATSSLPTFLLINYLLFLDKRNHNA